MEELGGQIEKAKSLYYQLVIGMDMIGDYLIAVGS